MPCHANAILLFQHRSNSKSSQVAVMGEVDPAFIQEPEHRPKPRLDEANQVPIIDLSPFLQYDPGQHGTTVDAVLVSQIHLACKNWGFFQVVNHGVPLEKRDKLLDASREFFAHPSEDKFKVRRNQQNFLGYYDTEHTKNVRDWKEVFDFVIEDPTTIPHDTQIIQCFNQWPEYFPQLREACEEYGKEMDRLARKLMELIALSLGLEQKRFEGFFKEQISLIRLNHYPPCPVPDLALGVGRHKDAGALTILAQDDVGGLQVKRKSDGEWVRVPPRYDAYVVNVGDIIQVWSNEIYESVEHRVMVNSEKDRFSVPYFFNPAHYTDVKPMDELTTQENNPPRYKPYNWGQFFSNRRNSNFRKLAVENIQIHHFRIPDSE